MSTRAGSSVLTKFLLFLVGAVVGGGVVFGVGKLTSGTGSQESSNSTGTRVKESLQFLVVLSRHGNKGVSYDYPSDPYNHTDTDYWPFGTGALTLKGRAQSYNLGLKLRDLYNGFIPSTFRSADLLACSDKLERVLMSGDLVLAGLYPPEGWQVWNKRVNWQPIALYMNSSDHSLDIDSCDRKVKDVDEASALFLVEAASNISTLSGLVFQETGQNLTGDQLAWLFQKLDSEMVEGYSLPDWTTSLYPDPLQEYYGSWYLAQAAPTDEVVRLYVGELFEEILTSLRSKAQGDLSDRKISYYSAHDSTLLNMQVALGVARAAAIKAVRTGSAVILELHKDSITSTFTIEVLYIDGGSTLEADPLFLSLSECGDPCELGAFVNSTTRFTNVNYTQECQITSSAKNSGY